MTVTLGTNAGFVTVSPSADPSGIGENAVDDNALATKDTSPAGNNIVTEIGWWCDNATEAANFEVGIYDQDVGNDEPEAVVGALSQTNAKGTTSGWKKVTGLNIPITASTIYWVAVQLDDTATQTDIDVGSGNRRATKTSQTELEDPWGASATTATNTIAIYAKVEAVLGGDAGAGIVGGTVF